MIYLLALLPVCNDLHVNSIFNRIEIPRTFVMVRAPKLVQLSLAWQLALCSSELDHSLKTAFTQTHKMVKSEREKVLSELVCYCRSAVSST
jgi:hypothetical protein